MRFLDEFREASVIAVAALRANKLRAGLTTLGIIIGIVTVTLMATAIDGLNRAFKKSIAVIGADVLFIQRFSWFSNEEEWRRSRNRRELTLFNAREVARLSNLARAVSVESSGVADVKYGNRSARSVWVVGNTEDSALVRGLTLTEGRWFSGSEVQAARPICVIGNDLAVKFFPLESPVGKRLRVGSANYEIIGVLDKMGQFFTGFNFDNQVVIPVTRFTSDLSRWPDVSIMVKVQDVKQMEEAKEELRGIMRQLRQVPPGAPDDFAINQQDALVNNFNQIGGTLALAGLFITGLSLFVGGIGVMNIMFVSVAERTREIGVRKAIGAKRRTILTQFLTEAALISLGAGLVGLLVAWPMTLVIDRFLAATMSIPTAIAALLVAATTGIVSGFLPAWRAARLNPVDALRSE
ncbi:MAG: ABC transporter permease [Verrucomicrobiales bacterium]|nr:ABC transporter permease [Verrucomicrobiales bacterium]